MATNIDKATGPGNGSGGILPILASEGPITVVIAGQDEEPETREEAGDKFSENLAEEGKIDSRELDAISNDLLADVLEDLNSRREWEDTYNKGLELLGLRFEERNTPWIGACGVYHPILSEAVVKFQSETIMETFPASGPVKAKVLGKVTKEKEEAAKRVAEDMNHELTDCMPEYRPEHERLLWALPIAGSAFKKVYFDPSLDRQIAMFVPAEDLIVPYGASTLESSPRITHRMRKFKNDVVKLQKAGFYVDMELGEARVIPTEIEKKKDKLTGSKSLNDERFTLYEIHCNLDIKGYEHKDEHGKATGIELPYVVTLCLDNRKVLSVYRNWEEGDETKQRRNHFVHYGYVPGFGFYCFGLIHLIGGFARSATSILRQLVDAGTLSNLPGGLKARGLRIKGDDTPIKPGEWRDVDVPSGMVKDNIVPLPYKEPSAVLATLLTGIVEEARRAASIADLKISDMSSQAPVGTTMAVLERTLKVMSAVQARIHAAMKIEFKLLKDIIRDNTPADYDYIPEGDDDTDLGRMVKQSDYDLVEIIPVSDPNATTMSQRIVQYQAAFQLAAVAPQIYSLPYLHSQMLENIGIKNVNKIIPGAEEHNKPVDPVSENMAILTGKPVKALLNQDHESHIQAHMAAAQDPVMQQMIGQSPQAAVIAAAFSAHMAEHVAMKYRKDMQDLAGVPLPAPDETLNDDAEVQLSQVIAAASGKLLQRDQQMAKMQQAAQQQQDPVMQLQQQENQIKAMEAQIKQAEVERKKAKDKSDNIIAMLKMLAEAKTEEQRLQVQQAIAGLTQGVQLATQATQHRHEKTLKTAELGSQFHQKAADQMHQKHLEGLKAGLADKHKQMDQQHAMETDAAKLEHEAGQAHLDRNHQGEQDYLARQHEAAQAEEERKHKLALEKAKPKPKPAAKPKK